MSLNKYNPTTGELTNIASSSRIWTGTKAEWNALVQAGTAPRNVLVAITDDEQAPSDTVTEDDENAVQGGAVWNAIHNPEKITVLGDGVKTAKQLLNEIYAQLDQSKLSASSRMIFGNNVLQYSFISLTFTQSLIQESSGKPCVQRAVLAQADSTWSYSVGSVVDQSSVVMPSGSVISLIY